MADVIEKKCLEKVHKKAVSKLRNTLELFNPENFTSEILKTSKDLWIKDVKDAFLAVDEVTIDLEEVRSLEEKQ